MYEILVKSDLVRKAYDLAKRAHNGQKSRNGEPFFNHCVATAKTLANWNLNQEVLAAGFLHHLPETSKGNPAAVLGEIEKEFGAEVSRLVAGVQEIN